jgi:hypothetical protein
MGRIFIGFSHRTNSGQLMVDPSRMRMVFTHCLLVQLKDGYKTKDVIRTTSSFLHHLWARFFLNEQVRDRRYSISLGHHSDRELVVRSDFINIS